MSITIDSADGEVYSIQHYMIKFVSDLRQLGGFLPVASTNKTDRNDITEILLKVAMNKNGVFISPLHWTISVYLGSEDSTILKSNEN